MSELTKDPNELMTRWMKLYMNLMILKSNNRITISLLDTMKENLIVAHSHMMSFFDAIGADPDTEG